MQEKSNYCKSGCVPYANQYHDMHVRKKNVHNLKINNNWYVAYISSNQINEIGDIFHILSFHLIWDNFVSTFIGYDVFKGIGNNTQKKEQSYSKSGRVPYAN